MPSLRLTLQNLRQRRRLRLPWAELEAEARRQGCSPADIFFDRAGRLVPGLPLLTESPTAANGAAVRGDQDAAGRPQVTRDVFGFPRPIQPAQSQTWGRPPR